MVAAARWRLAPYVWGQTTSLTPAGMIPSMGECRDRTIGRWVAKTASFTNGGRPGVVRVRHGQFGGEQDRLSGCIGDIGGRLCKTRILALVVCHDPLKAVVRVERPAASTYNVSMLSAFLAATQHLFGS